MVLARPDERETGPYHCSLSLFTTVRKSSSNHCTGRTSRARWVWPDLMNGRQDHTTAVWVSWPWLGSLPLTIALVEPPAREAPRDNFWFAGEIAPNIAMVIHFAWGLPYEHFFRQWDCSSHCTGQCSGVRSSMWRLLSFSSSSAFPSLTQIVSPILGMKSAAFLSAAADRHSFF